MAGNELDAQATVMSNRPANRTGTFATAAVAVLFVIAAVAITSVLRWPTWIEGWLIFFSIPAGAVVGHLIGRKFDRIAERRKALHAKEFREEQEREFQRKLAEAKAKGEI